MTSQVRAKLDATLEFFEISIHGILYARKIYPQSIFSLKQKYRMPVRIATHPKINEYIRDCLKTVKQLMDWDSMQHMTIVITGNNRTVERYVFQLLASNGDTDDYHIKMEQRFREYLLKLSLMEATLPKLPENSAFHIVIGTNTRSSVRLNDSLTQAHFPWLEVEKDEPSDRYSIIPVSSIKSKHLSVEMYIETEIADEG